MSDFKIGQRKSQFEQDDIVYERAVLFDGYTSDGFVKTKDILLKARVISERNEIVLIEYTENMLPTLGYQQKEVHETVLTKEYE